MNPLQATILGIIQGLTEFLPVSSSGHLVFFQNVFGLNSSMISFDVVLHLGTLIPVFIIFWKDIVSIICHPFQKMTLMLAIGTVPAIIVALLFDNLIEYLFSGTIFLAIGFFITGWILLIADRIKEGVKNEDEMTVKDAVIVGLMQAFAITPAVSRSGSTITGCLGSGLNRNTAAKFSFLLSIPAILGSAILESLKVFIDPSAIYSVPTATYLFGFISAALTGYLAINLMLKVIKNGKLKYFSYYVFCIGAFILIDIIFTHIFF